MFERPLALPGSREEIARIQSARKKIAFQRALQAPIHKTRLAGIDAEKLDDPEEWAKIPILHKEELRVLDPNVFMTDFNIAPRTDVQEFWRSGGSTGLPLFYPRTFEDMRFGFESFQRGIDLAGLTPDDSVHLSFPLGIHPVGLVFGRLCQMNGIGVNWAGAGSNTPSAIQIQLIDRLKPTVFMGMSSYAIHLANLAEAEGIDLASSSVRIVMCSAEPLSKAKRDKIERSWGAKVYDTFGMTEGGLMGAESHSHEGLVVADDLFVFEVLDPDTYEPVAEGEIGTLVMTMLYTNNATPFIRWSSGDLVSMTYENGTEGPYSVFPVLRHAHRTTGFFKVRGVNINHADFEDMMFRNLGVTDFKCELIYDGGNDILRVSLEVKGGADRETVVAETLRETKNVFEVTPEIAVLDTGTLAREFEGAIKAPRFQDNRG